jgi:hypothetical protein
MNEVNAATLAIRLKAITDQFQREMGKVSAAFHNTTDALRKNQAEIRQAGIAIGAVGAAVTAALGLMVQKAAMAGESVSKFHAVFKEESQQTLKWVDEFSKQVGRSRYDVIEWASSFQDTFVPLGFVRKEAAGLSKDLVKLGVDLGSFYNIAEPEVIQSLQSALVGNHEAVRKYGIILTESTLKQELMNMGIRKNTDDASAQEKVLARLRIIQKSTGDAQGDAARTADQAVNSFRALTGEIDKMVVSLGEHLIPITTQYIHVLTNSMRGLNAWIDANKEATDVIIKLVGVLGLLATAVGALMVGGASLLGMSTVITGLADAFLTLRIAVMLIPNPLWIIAGAIAVIITNWKNLGIIFNWVWESIEPNLNKFSKKMDSLVNKIREYLGLKGTVEEIQEQYGKKSPEIQVDLPGYVPPGKTPPPPPPPPPPPGGGGETNETDLFNDQRKAYKIRTDRTRRAMEQLAKERERVAEWDKGTPALQDRERAEAEERRATNEQNKRLLAAHRKRVTDQFEEERKYTEKLTALNPPGPLQKMVNRFVESYQFIRERFQWELERTAYWFNKEVLTGGWYNALKDLKETGQEAAANLGASILLEIEHSFADMIYNAVIETSVRKLVNWIAGWFTGKLGGDNSISKALKDAVWKGLEETGDIFSIFYSNFLGAWSHLHKAIQWALDWDNISGLFLKFYEYFTGIKDKVIDAISDGLNALKTLVNVGGFLAHFEKLKDKTSDAISDGLNALKTLVNVGNFLGHFEKIQEKVKDAISFALKALDIINDVIDFVGRFSEIKDKITSAIQWALDISNIGKTIEDFIDLFKDIKSIIVSAIKWALDDDGLRSAISSFSSLFSNIGSGVLDELNQWLISAVAFAAGVASGGNGNGGGGWQPGDDQNKIKSDFMTALTNWTQSRDMSQVSQNDLEYAITHLMASYQGAAAGSRSVSSVMYANNAWLEQYFSKYRKSGKIVPDSDYAKQMAAVGLDPNYQPNHTVDPETGDVVPGFASGGVIPGILGRARAIIGHAGEGIVNLSGMRGLGKTGLDAINKGASLGTTIWVNVTGNTILSDADASMLADRMVDAISAKMTYRQRYTT